MNQPTNSKSTQVYQITIIGILFFIFGFVTWLNGTLIQFLKLACDLKTDTQAFLVTFAFFMAYFFLAIPSSFILKTTGYKRGMALGLFVMALGSLVFIPAASERSFTIFLLGLFMQGMGLALLQTASNPYISIIGSLESAASRISIMGICNKVGGALSPLILGFIVFSDSDTVKKDLLAASTTAVKNDILNNLAARIVMPYTVLAVVLFALAVMLYFSNLPEIKEASAADDDANATEKKPWQIPYVILGALCIFMYVGAEVMAGDIIGTYGKNLGFGLSETKYFTTFTLVAMLAGYVIGLATIPKYISQEKSLLYAAIGAIVLSFIAYLTTGYTSVTCIALLGLFNAPMWPAIFPLGIRYLGKWTKLGSAFLVMGIAGGGVIPQIYGRLVDAHIWDFKLGFLLTLLACYGYVLWYAQRGYKIK